MKNQLYTRTYEGGNGEEVIVVGNRKDISDPAEGVMEAEFVFRDGKLIALNALRFSKVNTYTCHYVVPGKNGDEYYGTKLGDDQWFEMDIDAPKSLSKDGPALHDYLQREVRELPGRSTAVLSTWEKLDVEDRPFLPLPKPKQ